MWTSALQEVALRKADEDDGQDQQRRSGEEHVVGTQRFSLHRSLDCLRFWERIGHRAFPCIRDS
jgi:hypothetical protein